MTAPVTLEVGQLIYTSFRESGFTLLLSPGVLPLAQQSFFGLVETYWDAYQPPPPGYRAAYLHQIPAKGQGTLFGWLYHDGQDEFGRSDIPYFIAYYLPGKLQRIQLNAILNCLQGGPLQWVDRSDHLPHTSNLDRYGLASNDLDRSALDKHSLDMLNIDNSPNVLPVRQGIALPAQLWADSIAALEAKVPLNWFLPNAECVETSTPDRSGVHEPHHPARFKQPDRVEHNLGGLTMNLHNLDAILKELFEKPIGIQGVALVSSEGQIFTTPIGMNARRAEMLAGTMLYLVKSTQEELDWQAVETVFLRGQAGYLMLGICTETTYLLVQSSKMPMGLLEGEVNRAIARIRSEFQEAEHTNPSTTALVPVSEVAFVAESPTLLLDDEEEVTYRGRRAIQ
ncbi:MAG: hypothetical protein WCD18_14160 [Thermosynechococcaceae cyanobacterium]